MIGQGFEGPSGLKRNAVNAQRIFDANDWRNFDITEDDIRRSRRAKLLEAIGKLLPIESKPKSAPPKPATPPPAPTPTHTSR